MNVNTETEKRPVHSHGGELNSVCLFWGDFPQHQREKVLSAAQTPTGWGWLHRTFIMEEEFDCKATFPGNPDDDISKDQLIRARFSEMTLRVSERLSLSLQPLKQEMKPLAEEGGDAGHRAWDQWQRARKSLPPSPQHPAFCGRTGVLPVSSPKVTAPISHFNYG